jgi:glycosyltransferase involved in cell wall biosynthesis
MVSARFLPDLGGTEMHCYEVARRLVKSGVDVTIVTTRRDRTRPTFEVIDGVPVRRVNAWPANRDYYLAPGVWDVIRRGGWDLVHCQGVHTLVAPLAMAAARRAGLPCVVTFHTGGHSSSLRQRARTLQWTALRPLLRHAAALVGVSRFEARLFQERLGLPAERFAVIRNGSELPVAPAPREPNAGTLLVSVGRLERYKGHQRVIRALPIVRRARPDARLLILGSGPYELALRQSATRHGVADYVDIESIPSQNRTEMAARLSQAALVTLLSDYEAHPIAVMEALGLGRPVLVADTSGLRELAEDGLVRSVAPTASPARVAEAIVQQLDHPLVPDAVELADWDQTAARLLAVYRSVLRRTSSA